MSLDLIVTNAGRAALINAANSGTLPVTIAQIGLSAAALVPSPATTALSSEITRIAAISGEVVADDTIHVTLKDDGAGAYSLRSFALYLADGTLFAVYGQSTPILVKTASSIALLSIDVIFADIDAASITFGDAEFSNPQATTERLGVVELATVVEAKAGADSLRVLTPAAAKAALMDWLLSQDGPGSGLDADSLDGQNGAWYADVVARLGFTPLAAAAFTPLNVLTLIKMADGAGSELDADLLDGFQGNAYSRLIASDPSENGGYRIYADGYRECWGKVLVPGNAQDFGIAFPSDCRFNSYSNVVGSSAGSGVDAKDNAPGVRSTSLTGFTVSSAVDNGVTFWWQAKGY